LDFELIFFFAKTSCIFAKKTSSDIIREKPAISRFQTPKGTKRGEKREKAEKKSKKNRKNRKKGLKKGGDRVN
jgi:hypothetical protein